jgi:hypothetical protein
MQVDAPDATTGLNRTDAELKLHTARLIDSFAPCLNRTDAELKPPYCRGCQCPLRRLNRTDAELKPKMAKHIAQVRFWNGSNRGGVDFFSLILALTFLLHIDLLPAISGNVDLLRVVDRHQHIVAPPIAYGSQLRLISSAKSVCQLCSMVYRIGFALIQQIPTPCGILR